MDVGVYLNGKYAIICRKTVLIPENDEEMCFIAEENFVRKIAVHRLRSSTHSSYLRLQLLRELDFIWMQM